MMPCVTCHLLEVEVAVEVIEFKVSGRRVKGWENR